MRVHPKKRPWLDFLGKYLFLLRRNLYNRKMHGIGLLSKEPFGEVYHGSKVKPEACSFVLRKNSYRHQILLGAAMVRAHLGEREAPPFGLYVDRSAQDLITITETFPFDLWWRWYTANDVELLNNLRQALDNYFTWYSNNAQKGYKSDRIRIHRGQAALYLTTI